MENKVVASIEARMASKRLPGKVLMESINGIPMLEFMIKRVLRSKKIDQVVVATSNNNLDNSLLYNCVKN